ncbi:MAG: MerR family transcriptional regulator, partial [Acutalibacteraceae bacterium]
VKEVSKITGVSVRTLHYYDEIGLLKPTKVTGAGYRLYDDTALERLQSILLFRELQFPLKEIKAILDSPGFDRSAALSQQIELLELQYKHIGELISFAREIQNEGVRTMNFDVFDNSEIKKYKEEAKARWGDTKAFREFEQKSAAQSDGDFADKAKGMMSIFSEIGKLKHLNPDDEKVQAQIAALQKFITDNFYACTDEILISLSEMYVGDERFKNNIDKAGGKGTAEFVRAAIAFHLK